MQHANLANLAEIKAVIEEIRGEFLKKLETYHQTLDEIIEAGATFDGVGEAMFIAHRIGGVAGTLGFDHLGRVAQIAEGKLSDIREENGQFGDVSAALDVIEALADFVSSVRNGNNPAALRAVTI